MPLLQSQSHEQLLNQVYQQDWSNTVLKYGDTGFIRNTDSCINSQIHCVANSEFS